MKKALDVQNEGHYVGCGHGIGIAIALCSALHSHPRTDHSTTCESCVIFWVKSHNDTSTTRIDEQAPMMMAGILTNCIDGTSMRPHSYRPTKGFDWQHDMCRFFGYSSLIVHLISPVVIRGYASKDTHNSSSGGTHFVWIKIRVGWYLFDAFSSFNWLPFHSFNVNNKQPEE